MAAVVVMRAYSHERGLRMLNIDEDLFGTAISTMATNLLCVCVHHPGSVRLIFLLVVLWCMSSKTEELNIM